VPTGNLITALLPFIPLPALPNYALRLLDAADSVGPTGCVAVGRLDGCLFLVCGLPRWAGLRFYTFIPHTPRFTLPAYTIATTRMGYTVRGTWRCGSYLPPYRSAVEPISHHGCLPPTTATTAPARTTAGGLGLHAQDHTTGHTTRWCFLDFPWTLRTPPTLLLPLPHRTCLLF